ncbi:hypothetical protein JKP88DRAFT_287571 [Tribonema minus]|uniref:Uncharacterized protein n=1 Tax=Tribonema minus TaxID=303371 RepID=A0A835Z7S9_9STRA|nr:hypothetical protein JKP88DRAFT_287571 [Tribonema minus]
MEWRRRVHNYGVAQCLGQLLYPQLFNADLQRFLVVAVPIDTAPASPAGGAVISIDAAVLSLRTAADIVAASGAAAASAAAASTASVSTPAAVAAAPLLDAFAAAVSTAGTGMPAALLLLAALQAAHEAGHAAAALAQRMNVHWPPRPLPLGPFGAFGTLLRPASVPPNASALFGFAAAGPTAGALASLVMLVAGLQVTLHPTAGLIRAVFACNLVLGARYLLWRCTKSLPLEDGSPAATAYAYIYLLCEAILVMSIWMSHCTRLLPAVRPIIRVDDLIEASNALDTLQMANAADAGSRAPSEQQPGLISIAEEARVAILLPTAGEGLPVLLRALLGCFSQKLWEPPTIDGKSLGEREQLRIVVLDERRRTQLLQLCKLVYVLARTFKELQRVLQQHTAAAATAATLQQTALANAAGAAGAAGADEAAGSSAQEEDTPIDMHTAQAVAGSCLLDVWDKFAPALSTDASVLTSEMSVLGTNTAVLTTDATHSGPAAVVRAFKAILATMTDVQQLVAGSLPLKGRAASPFAKIKPGHIAEFMARSDVPALIYHTRKDAGQPTISPKAGNLNAAIYNLCSNTGLPLTGTAKAVLVNDARHYLLPDFLQRTVPYLFELTPDGMGYQWGKVCFVQTPQRFKDDGIGNPLANWGAVKFNITNVGKDGAGAVTSCGQGAVWRVDALSEECHHQRNVTSGSCHVDALSEGAHADTAPDTVQWRMRQIYRWHVGGVITLLQRGLRFLLDPRSGSWPNLWHRVFLFNSLMYYFRSFGALAIMFMPIAYGVFGVFPFETIGSFGSIRAQGLKLLEAATTKRVFTEMQFFAASAFMEVFSIVQTVVSALQVIAALSGDHRGLISALAAGMSVYLMWPMFR